MPLFSITYKKTIPLTTNPITIKARFIDQNYFLAGISSSYFKKDGTNTVYAFNNAKTQHLIIYSNIPTESCYNIDPGTSYVYNGLIYLMSQIVGLSYNMFSSNQINVLMYQTGNDIRPIALSNVTSGISWCSLNKEVIIHVSQATTQFSYNLDEAPKIFSIV